MKLLLLIASIVIFIIGVIIALTNGTWDSVTHLFVIAFLGLAAFASSFLPIP